MVFAHANACTRVELGATLAHDDAACVDGLAAVNLNA
jgi:hypothetical protein